MIILFRFNIQTNGKRVLDPDTLASYPLGISFEDFSNNKILELFYL